jgi:biotin carboxylase
MKMLLSVGAGIEQVPVILRAKSLGYSVLAVDRNPSAPGLSFSDIGMTIESMNEDLLISTAKFHGVIATLPIPIGKLLVTQGAVNDALGLRGVSREAALSCTDKVRFHNLAGSIDVLVPRQFHFSSFDKLFGSDIAKHDYPMVVKPVDGSGSRGVLVVSSPNDVFRLFERDCGRLYSHGLILEDYIDGKVLGIDGAVVNNNVFLTLIREKDMSPWPHRVELTHRGPANVSISVATRALESLRRVVSSLKLNNSVFHADAILSIDNELFLIEFSARPSGAKISDILIPLCTGLDFLTEAIRLQVDGEGSFVPKHSMPSLLTFFNLRSGLLTRVPSVPNVINMPFVVDAKINLKEGDILSPPQCVGDLIDRGYLVMSGNNFLFIQKSLDRIISMFEIKAT